MARRNAANSAAATFLAASPTSLTDHPRSRTSRARAGHTDGRVWWSSHRCLTWPNNLGLRSGGFAGHLGGRDELPDVALVDTEPRRVLTQPAPPAAAAGPLLSAGTDCRGRRRSGPRRPRAARGWSGCGRSRASIAVVGSALATALLWRPGGASHVVTGAVRRS